MYINAKLMSFEIMKSVFLKGFHQHIAVFLIKDFCATSNVIIKGKPVQTYYDPQK